MVSAVTGFAPLLVDLGTRDAVVQRAQIKKGEVSAVFWITVAMGFVFAALVAATGPLIARFYGEPRLVKITVVSSLNFIVVGLINQHQALMRRALMFRELALIDVGGNLVSACVGIGLALCGFGYWALVTRGLAMFCFMAVGVWTCCPWRPGRPEFTSAVRDMLKFGINITGSALSEFAGKSVDRIIIGRELGPKVLGYYQQSLFVYSNLMDVFSMTFYQVAIVSLSKLQKEPEEFRRCWAKALSTVAFYTMPGFGLLAVISPDLIAVLLGQRWAAAGVILSVLALRGIPHVVERTVGWLYISTGRTDRCLRYNVIAMVVQIVALFCGLPFGLTGVATAYTISMFGLFVPAVAYAGRPVHIEAFDVVKAVGAQLTGALVAAAVGFGLRYLLPTDLNSFLRVFVLGGTYLATYFVIVVAFFNIRAPFRVLEGALRGFLPARFSRVAEEHI
jgi:PST family polysaccharide transporter